MDSTSTKQSPYFCFLEHRFQGTETIKIEL